MQQPAFCIFEIGDLIMRKFSLKKLSCFILSLLLVISAIFSNTVSTNAATNKYINLLHKVSTARPNFPIRYNFSLAKASDIYFDLKNNERTTVTISMKNKMDESSIVTDTLSSADPRWEYHQNTGIYQYTHTMNLASGDYILELNFEAEVNYELSVSKISPDPVLKNTKLLVTKGFTSAIKVDGGKIKSCSSANKQIATVTNSGKVTGKKEGNAKVTVKLTNGKKLICNVSVKSNKYSGKKLTISDTTYNQYGLKVYSAHFDNKGNLVVKFMVANNSYGKLTKIPKLKITVKDSKKNVVASFKKNSYTINVNSYKSKSYTICFCQYKSKKNLLLIRKKHHCFHPVMLLRTILFRLCFFFFVENVIHLPAYLHTTWFINKDFLNNL